jgi:hypothetical protein
MSRRAFKSDPLPFTLSTSQYVEGQRVQLPVEDLVKEPYNIKKVVEFAGSDDPKAKVDLSGKGDFYNFIPVKQFIVDADSAEVISKGAVRPYHSDRIVSPMIWTYKGSMASKDDLAIMDIMAGNDWKRPFYYAVTVPGSKYIGLENYFVLEGMAFRVSPVTIDKPAPGETGMVDPDEMYENMMNRFKWGNAEDPDVYLDENNRRLFDVFRRQFGRLSKALASEGDTLRAVAAAEKGLAIVPPSKMPYDYFSLDLAEGLLMAGRVREAEELIGTIIDNSVSTLSFMEALPERKMYGLEFQSGVSLQAIVEVYYLATERGLDTLAGKAGNELNRFYNKIPVR